MKTTRAIASIERTVARMEREFGRVVFDEWILFSVAARHADIHHYAGPREEDLGRSFNRDIHLLIDEIREGTYQPGHFYFTREAEGTAYDAFMAAGPEMYIVFNNTELSMEELTGDPLWTEAQVPFVELSERFHTDPLQA